MKKYKIIRVFFVSILMCILFVGCGEKKTLRDEEYANNTPKENSVTGVKALDLFGGNVVHENGYTIISGSVKNIGDSTISYYEVTIKLIDENGDVLDSVWTNNSGQFQTGESSKWEKSFKYDERMRRYSASVTKVSY